MVKYLHYHSSDYTGDAPATNGDRQVQIKNQLVSMLVAFQTNKNIDLCLVVVDQEPYRPITNSRIFFLQF